MNARQHRKHLRRLSRASGQQHQLIRDWDDLAQVPESLTHRLEIDVEGGNGWIYEKGKGKENDLGHYLSTHTFYGSQHRRSTLLLRKCGFNVTCTNWDAL